LVSNVDDAPAALRLGDFPYQRSNALKAPSASAPATVKGTPAPHSIPLDIKSAIAPYRGRRRLSMRIEGIPQSARLSAGTNNGDGTWSLALDEIEDLSYLPSEGSGNRALRLRVISKEDDVASTVALLDLPVTTMPGTGHSSGRAENPKTEAKASAKIAPGPKTPELKLIHITERGRHDGNPPLSDDTADRIARELASTRTLWEAELRQHMESAAAEAALNLRHHQAAWTEAQECFIAVQQKEIESRVAEAIEITRWELQAAAELDLQQHKTAWTEAQERFTGAQQKETESRVAEAIEIARRESQAEAVRTAEQSRNAESAKLASIEARWRAREEKTQKQADLRLAALAQQVNAERNELQGELQAAKDDSNKSDSALRAANLALTQQEETWKAKLKTALSEAKGLWAVLEDTRLKEAEDRLLAQFEQTLAERDQVIANAGHGADPANASHTEKIEALTRRVEARDFELAQLRTHCDEQAAATEASLKDARETWQRAEAERLNAAEAKWQAASSASLADHAKIDALARQVEARNLELAQLRTPCDGQAAATEASLKDARETWQRAEAERLNVAEAKWQAASSASLADQGEIDTLTSQVAARDLELAQLRTHCERQAAVTETALKDAQTTWQRAEAERLKAAEAKWQANLSTSLADYAARCQALELELSQACSTSEIGRGGDDAYIARINREIKTLKATVADREAALALTQASLDKLRLGRSPDILSERAARFKASSQDETSEESDQKSSHLVRDAIILMVVVVIAILAFPTLESLLPDDLRFQIESLVGSHEGVQAAPAPAKIKAPPPSAPRVTATIIRSANMRIAPLPSAAIVSRLKAGLTVAVLEKKGHWQRIDVPASHDKPQQGWVYDANMRNAPGASRSGGDATP
jgi:Bacterial SH3 domain